MKIVKQIQLKIVIFTAVKNRCILHGRLFVMMSETTDLQRGRSFHNLPKTHDPKETIF